MTVHFICRGNAFRSIIAEAYLNSLHLSNLKVISSGTVASKCKDMNAANFPKTLGLLKKHGIGQYAKDHYADDISQDLLDESDIAIFLNKRAYDEAGNKYKLPQKTYIWDVADLGEEGRVATTQAERRSLAEDVYDEIVKNVDDLVVRYRFKK